MKARHALIVVTWLVVSQLVPHVYAASTGALDNPADGAFARQIAIASGAALGQSPPAHSVQIYGLDFLRGQINPPPAQADPAYLAKWKDVPIDSSTFADSAAPGQIPAAGALDVAFGDLDGDGQDEMIVSNLDADPNGTNSFAILRLVNGAYAHVLDLATFGGGGTVHGIRVATGDIDGDQKAEILVGQINAGNRVWIYHCDVTSVPPSCPSASIIKLPGAFTSDNGVDVAAGDLDGDGIDELVVSQLNDPGRNVKVYDYVPGVPPALGTMVERAATTVGYFGCGQGITVAVGRFDDGPSGALAAGREQILVGQGPPASGGTCPTNEFGVITPTVSGTPPLVTALPAIDGTDSAWSGGLDVAAGNVDGDPFDEIVITKRTTDLNNRLAVFGFDPSVASNATWSTKHPRIDGLSNATLGSGNGLQVAVGVVANSPTQGATYFTHSGESILNGPPKGAAGSSKLATAKYTRALAGERSVNSAPVVGRDGTVYVGTWGDYTDAPYRYQGKIYALKPDLTSKWSAPYNPDTDATYTGTRPDVYGTIEGGPILGTDGRIYFGRGDHRLWAISDLGTSAHREWTYQTFDRWNSQGQPEDQAAGARGDSNYPNIGGQIIASPIIDTRGIIYFATVKSTGTACTNQSNAVYAVATRDLLVNGQPYAPGDLVWRYPSAAAQPAHQASSVATTFYAAPVLNRSEDTLYVATFPRDSADACNLQQIGSDAAVAADPEQPQAPATDDPITDGLHGYVIALNTSNGAKRWTFTDDYGDFALRISSAFFTSLALDSNGTLYAGGMNLFATHNAATVYAIKDAGTKPKLYWRFKDVVIENNILNYFHADVSVSSRLNRVYMATGVTGEEFHLAPLGGKITYVPLASGSSIDPSQVGGPYPAPTGTGTIDPPQLLAGVDSTAAMGGTWQPAVSPNGRISFSTRGRFRINHTTFAGTLLGLKPDLSLSWYWKVPAASNGQATAELEWGGRPVLGTAGSANDPVVYVSEKLCTDKLPTSTSCVLGSGARVFAIGYP